MHSHALYVDRATCAVQSMTSLACPPFQDRDESLQAPSVQADNCASCGGAAAHRSISQSQPLVHTPARLLTLTDTFPHCTCSGRAQVAIGSVNAEFKFNCSGTCARSCCEAVTSQLGRRCLVTRDLPTPGRKRLPVHLLLCAKLCTQKLNYPTAQQSAHLLFYAHSRCRR